MKLKKQTATIDNKLTIHKHNHIDTSLYEQIKQANTFSNPTFESASKQGMSTRHIPKEIQLFKETDEYIQTPAPFLNNLLKGMSKNNIEVCLKDLRIRSKTDFPETNIDLRTHQKEAVESLIENTYGIYQAPPGAGKTVISLHLAKQTQSRTLIVVDKQHIAKQWQERAKQFLDIETGMIGCGENLIGKQITVGLVQTLKNLEILKSIRNEFSLVIADECHHASSTTWFEVLNSINSYRRYGVSATPDRENQTLHLVTAALGKVVTKLDSEQLIENKVIVKPKVKIIHTDFRKNYFPNHQSSECHLHKDCNSKTKRMHVNNYSKIVSSTTQDIRRTKLICKHIDNNYGRKQLVISKRLKHLDDISANLKQDHTVFFLTGKETLEERDKVASTISSMTDGCVVFSTLADEALDIPSLDTIHLTFPTKSIPLLKQQVGRIERSSPDKPEPIVFDYADDSVSGILERQYFSRLYELYVNNNYKVEHIHER